MKLENLKRAGFFDIEKLQKELQIEIQCLKQIKEPRKHLNSRIKAHSKKILTEYEQSLNEIMSLYSDCESQDVIPMVEAIDCLKTSAIGVLDAARSKWAEALEGTYNAQSANQDYAAVRSELHPQFDAAREKINSLARDRKRKLMDKFK